ncbi:MAG: TonB family protein [Acidobacteria bacterium]|nr:TonB family protein [Acidobacteriota bacterium]
MKSLMRLLKLNIISLSCIGLFAVTLSGSPVNAAQSNDTATDKILAEIVDLNTKIARDPNDALSHFKLGYRYLITDHWVEGIDALEKAVQIKPDFAVAHYRLGWAYLFFKKGVEALKAHEQALAFAHLKSFEMEVTKIDVQYAIGWTYYTLSRYDEAIAAYQKALQFEPWSQNTIYEIGRVHLVQGNRDEALQIAGKLPDPLNEWLRKEVALSSIPAGAETSSLNQANLGRFEPMTATIKPVIHYKEKVKYTDDARRNGIQGIVVLNVVFFAVGSLGSMRVVRGLPYGLTAQAILAADKIRFQPAQRDGKNIAVRGTLEFSFNLI